MPKHLGTVVRGIRTPIICQHDDLVKIVVDSLFDAMKHEGFQLKPRDVLGITEAVVARAQGNYANADHIAEDIRMKFPCKEAAVVFPILSRNRFATCLKGIARGLDKVFVMLSYPADEVGNHLIDIDALDACGINPWTDVLDEKEFRRLFGSSKHIFTGIDYVEHYNEIIRGEGAEPVFIFANSSKEILKYTKYVLCCDIHTRIRTKKQLKNAGAETVFGLDDVLNRPVNGSGYNDIYGLLGSNKATDDSVKLFPRDSDIFAKKVQAKIHEKSGVEIEVMVYGDGAFKDPVGKIWELADPVVSPGYTSGLSGMPNEVKLKYLADNRFANLSGEELKKAIAGEIRNKKENLADKAESGGTTPRRYTDLLGSLCDLTSGSGDKGTPIVLVQGYFDNYAD